MNPKALTEEQASQLYAEYMLWLENKPKKLCKRYGIARTTLDSYVKRRRAA
jgi:hypothetical protein